VWNGKELHDNTAVKDCKNLKHGATLYLKGMTIRVKLTDGRTTISLNVKPSDKVKDMKTKLKDKEGIPICEQRLVFGKKVLDDSLTLSDYKIKHGYTLHLEPMQILVKTPEGKTMTIEVKSSDTVYDVKKKVNAKEGIPVDEQHLSLVRKSWTMPPPSPNAALGMGIHSMWKE
jgi:ubiquitin C